MPIPRLGRSVADISPAKTLAGPFRSSHSEPLMRVVLPALAVFFASFVTRDVVAQTTTTGSVTTYQETYICPKCGKTHLRTVSRPAANSRVEVRKPPIETANPPKNTESTAKSVVKPVTTGLRATSGVSNVMSALNAQRSRRGVAALLYDPQLQAVAERRARQMAASGSKNHPPGSFAPGRYEGVGWSSSYSPSGVSACYTSDSRMRYAGAAMATGRDGVYFAVVYR